MERARRYKSERTEYLDLKCNGTMEIWDYIYIYIVFTTEGLFEVAIESWPE